jgi:chemotaxis protein CheX
MSTTVQAEPQSTFSPVVWNPILESAAREIFTVMLGLPLEHAFTEPPLVADVTVMVGFSGSLRGIFGLHCTAATACRLATLLLGMETDEFDERVLDACGEVANMVAGSFKSKVPTLGENCILSVPTVISGADYHLHSTTSGEHAEMSLSFEGLPLWLTLDLRK